jgi:plasmid stabilization system protein ParE
MPFRVEITDLAYAEVSQAYAWLAERSPVAAERWRQSLFEVVESLTTFPERCGLAPEDEWYQDGLRQLLYGKRHRVYRVLFRIRGEVVQVLRVRHGAQDFLGPGDLPENEGPT